MMRKHAPAWGVRALITLLFAAAGLAGCSDLTGPNLRGTYDLLSFAGQPLPATIAIQGGSMTMHRANLVLHGSRRFELSVERLFCLPDCNEESFAETGIYSITGSGLVFLLDGGGRIDGEYTTDRIVLYDESPGSVWIKR